ncbi:L-rhamnose-binding lectin CSL1-like [Clinocottus analis]|uniref:L-rhamnose-binding lectin CSL1-like n=1 Tax=Clinocottus analis TaxID=304258 RepID=UPI0035C1F585
MLSFTLSTTLLLAATCSLMTAVVSAERVITCSGGSNVQHLSCDSGVIGVQGALYGRADKETCSKGTPAAQLANTKCSLEGTLDLLKKRCNGRRECELNLKVVLTSDPCPGISKYLDTNYTCFPANHLVACENSLAHLQCDEGQVIFVYGADYGRRDQTTCTFSQRASAIKNVACSNPTSKVADSCNGKNSCTISASNSVFGDPCAGTYKYLEVAYGCECPEQPGFDQPPSGSSKSMLSFRLSTTLLLAATCSLMTAGKYLIVSTERVITCESLSNVQHLSCDSGVIGVQGALYGRADKETCSKGRPAAQLANTECSLEGTLDVLKKRCNGRRVCELNLNIVLTSDPCPGISKYLDTNYTCFPANHLVTCENSLAHLQCDEGQVIFVYGADYGRRDQTTCVFQKPASQIKNDACSNPTSKVADSCNGKNSCTISATNMMFGDPCVGTYKYLEVAYRCECKYLKNPLELL